MARSLRILLSTNSIATTTSSPPPAKQSAAAQPSQYVNFQSDYVITLAALLCALICVVGLIAVARCAWLRRRSPEQRSANKGLKKKILQSLPKRTFDSSTAGAGNGGAAASDCAICLAEYVDGDEIRVLPYCGHVFHVHCIDTWLGSHSSCPSCRQILAVARCQKCGEFTTAKVSGGKHPAAETQVKASRQDRAAAAAAVASSSSGDFLP